MSKQKTLDPKWEASRKCHAKRRKQFKKEGLCAWGCGKKAQVVDGKRKSLCGTCRKKQHDAYAEAHK